MQSIFCPECGKKTPFQDEFAGKNLKCACGTVFQAPSKGISGEQISSSNIQPTGSIKGQSNSGHHQGNYDPQLEKLIAIALKDGIITDKERQILIKKAVEFGVDPDEFEMELDSRIPTKGNGDSGMNIGNDNIVKANIKGGGKNSKGSGMPVMNMGNDNVIKAEINASTSITHDNSLKVKGSYVANQTIINESAFSSIVKFFTGTYNSQNEENIDKQIEQLGNDPAQLENLLNQTLRHMLREVKNNFKQGGNKKLTVEAKGIFAFNKEMSKTDGIGYENHSKISLVEKILNKLHDIGHDSKNPNLLLAIEKLDNCLITTKELLKKTTGKPFLAQLKPMYFIFKKQNIPYGEYVPLGVIIILNLLIIIFIALPLALFVDFLIGILFIMKYLNDLSENKIIEKYTYVENMLNELNQQGLVN